MLSRFDRMLFRRQSEGVESYKVVLFNRSEHIRRRADAPRATPTRWHRGTN
jgi:hypothetical protein